MNDFLHLLLSLPATEIGRLRRHPALGIPAGQPVRAVAVRTTWYDTADGALAQRGLVLAASRRAWRLERSHPGTGNWPPATAAPVLAHATSLAGLAASLPDDVAGDHASALAPVAGLSARETTITVGGDPGAVTARILRGTIRAGERAMPCAQLALEGPAPAVLALARALAGTVTLFPPRASLAAEAAALRDGSNPPPRRTGTFAVADGLTVGDAFPHIVAHLTDVMLFWAAAIGEPGDDPEPVHQMRVAMRRMRSAISIFRDPCASPAILAAGSALRDLGHVLGPARDWDVFLGGLGQRVASALPEDQPIRALLRGGERQRMLAYRRLAAHLASPAFRHLAIDLAAIGAGQAWRDGLDENQIAALQTPLETFAAELLGRRHRRVRKRGDHFRHLDVPALHEVRLAAKRLRYAAEFFAALFAARPAARYIRRLGTLQDQLGHLNDGAVADTLLAALGRPGGRNGYAIGLVRGWVASESAMQRGHLARVWKRFRKLDPFWT